MRSIAIGLICCMSVITASAQTRTDVTMMVDSVAREFIVVVPSGTPPAQGYPMVLMLHGTSGDGEKFFNISGWKEKGEQENFVTVFPSSLRYCFYTDAIGGPTNNTTKWKNGEASAISCPDQWMKDDVHFLSKMIDTIVATLPIDRSRIYAAGFSNGGGMASKLAVELCDKLAAVQASASALHENDWAPITRSLPVWFAVGSLDDRWTVPMGVTELPFNDSTAGGYLRNTINRYLTALGLTEDYTKDSAALTLTYTFSTPSSSSSAYEFKFTLIKGLDHSYPNGSNFSFAAVDIVWPWFKQYTLPGATSVSPIPESAGIGFFPNPATDNITVEGVGSCTVSLYSMLGQLAYHGTTERGIRIALPHLAPGIYRMMIETQANRVVKLLAIR